MFNATLALLLTVAPAKEYQTAKGLLEDLTLDVRVGTPGLPSQRDLPPVTINYRLIFKEERLEEKAKKLDGKFVSVDGYEAFLGGKSYFLVVAIFEVKND